jgi:hypothetical protein
MHVNNVEPKIGDPLHEPGEGRLVWQLGAQGCRSRAYGDLAVVEFFAQY